VESREPPEAERGNLAVPRTVVVTGKALQDGRVDPQALVLDLARELGFDLAGIAPLAPPPDAARFERWLDEGHHGSMGYLERFRDRIVDPGGILPGGRSMLVVGLGHSRPEFALADGARVARYAAGRDYHNVLRRKLRKLARRLQQEGLVQDYRSIVDAGPLMERSHAAAAGVGFESKAANLLHPSFGPWFFLGELLLDVELEPTGPPEALESPPLGSCGTCTACLDACPTGAILEPGLVHSPTCLSYQTIEQRGSIPRAMREHMSDWVFGCDVCSEVCPWGRSAPDVSARYGVHPALAEGGLVRWLSVGDEFLASFEGSPLRRPGRAGLARNAAIGLGHRPSEEGRRALLQALDFDPEPLVREAAAWSLSRGFGADHGTRAALEAALARETDSAAQADIRASLDGVA